jgi:hypothetical protein
MIRTRIVRPAYVFFAMRPHTWAYVPRLLRRAFLAIPSRVRCTWLEVAFARRSVVR